MSGGTQASLPRPVSGCIVTPTAGLRLAVIGGGSLAETAGGALAVFALSGSGATQQSVIPCAEIAVSRDLIACSGLLVRPYGMAGFQYQAGDSERAVLLTAADGTTFSPGSVRLDRAAGRLGVGVVASQGAGRCLPPMAPWWPGTGWRNRSAVA